MSLAKRKNLSEKDGVMEVLLWAAAGGFAAAGYRMAKKLGLFDEVPRDDQARAAFYSSNALVTIKDQLFGSEIVSCGADRVVYLRRGKENVLWSETGTLCHCSDGHQEQRLSLGDLGRVVFSLVGDKEISVEITVSETQGGEHFSQVAIRVLPVLAKPPLGRTVSNRKIAAAAVSVASIKDVSGCKS